MAAFATAVEITLRHEGGYVFNPLDPGGATNMGVTQGVLQAWRKQFVTAADVQALTKTEAVAIYNDLYWRPIQGDAIKSQDMANWCFDMAVLRGVGAAALSMQAALGVPQDGAVGPKTVTALNACDPAVFLNAFRSLCLRKFVSLAQARPASLQFLPGWVRRAEEMSDTVNQLLQKKSAQGPAA